MNFKLKNNLLSLAILVVLLFTWQQAAKNEDFVFLFASPKLIFQSLIGLFTEENLIGHILITSYEAFAGFIIGIILGTTIGFLLWLSPLIASISLPYIFVLSAIPVLTFAPMIIVWFGIDTEMKIALSAFGTFLICLNQAYIGAENTGKENLRLFKILGASRFQTLTKLIIPSSLNWVINGLDLSINVALLGAFVGEFISANQGVGYLMVRAGSLYDIPKVMAGGFCLLVISIGFRGFVRVSEK